MQGILRQIAAGKVPNEEADRLPGMNWKLRQALSYLREVERFGIALSRGALSAELHARGAMAGGLKGLLANLRHLTWQTKQAAEGDLTQQVAFMGEFSAAFDNMGNKLREARDELFRKYEELQIEIDVSSTPVQGTTVTVSIPRKGPGEVQ